MPPKSTKRVAGGRTKSGKTSAAQDHEPESSNPFESSSDERSGRRREDSVIRDERADGEDAESEDEEPEKTIPKDLLTRLLHDFFAKDSTRISRDANAAVGKYVDIFLREAIARAASERKGGFFEVEDLEKVAPQLLLDL